MKGLRLGAAALAAAPLLLLMSIAPSAGAGGYGYDDATESAGLTFRHASDGTNDAIYTEIMGPGACVLDYDGDGLEDLFLVNSLYREDGNNEALDPRSHLYRNQGDGTFAESAVAAGADLRGWFLGCTAGDYDDDGDTDLYATAYGMGTLLRNEGDGTFANVTAQAGVGGEFCGDVWCWGSSAAFLDYDQDGDLDLYRANYLAYDITVGGPTSPGFYPQQDAVLWRNEGDGNFTDVTLEAGVRNLNGNGLGVAVQDYDLDGWPDIFVANDETPDALYHNLGNGTFEDVAPTLQVDDARGGMGTAWGDYDLDGRADLTITHYYQERYALYHQEPSGLFADQGDSRGLEETRNYVGWGAEFMDVDNDGWPDLVYGNGHVSSNFSLGGGYGQRNTVFLNDGQGNFRNATAEMGAFDEDFEVTRGLAFLDLNRDGYVDWVAANNANQTASLYTSQRGPNNFLELQLAGDASTGTRDALGAVVEVAAGGRTWRKEVETGGSYLSQSSLRVHAGLGAEEAADLEVIWPDGAVQTFPGVAANRFYRLSQGGALEVVRDWPLVRAPAAASADVLTDVTLEGTVVRLPADADPDLVQHRWDWGDGATSAERIATHRYAANGDYEAVYRATDASGRWDEAVVAVRVVNVLPEARLAGPSGGTRLDTLAFDGSASSDADGDIAAWRWDFGDGATAEGSLVEHRYASLGTFTVQLTVEDADGATDAASQVVAVRNLDPVADAGPDLAGNTASSLLFDASQSSDPDGAIAGWFWDFGDGTQANGERVTHTYTALGLFTVNLTVVDGDGGVAMDTALAAISAANAPPQADAGPDQVADRITSVAFSAAGSRDPDGYIFEYAWDFGDGAVALGREVAHRYAALGTYTVTLTIRDDALATGMDTMRVEVRNLPPAAVPGPGVDHEGLGPVAFDGSASSDPEGSALDVRWDFGDGTSAASAVVQHAYAAYGRFSARLTVTDADGASASGPRAVWVYARPVARAGEDRVTDRLSTVAFDGTASSDADGTLVRHTWDFGDGTGAEGPLAGHRYTALGVFRVTLSVQDNDGFVAVDEAWVEVRNLPPIPVLRGYALANVNQALIWDGGSSWDPDGFLVEHSWAFSDGGTASGQRPLHAFAAPGAQEVRLAVRDNDGGAAEAVLAVDVVTWLDVRVAMDKEEWMFNEDPAGEVQVRFANGLALKGAAFALNVTYKVKPPRLNQLPEEVDLKTVFLDLTTDSQGRARFTVPSDWPEEVAPLLPTFHLPTVGHEALLRRHMGSVLATAPVAWQGNDGAGEARYYVRTNDLDVG